MREQVVTVGAWLRSKVFTTVLVIVIAAAVGVLAARDSEIAVILAVGIGMLGVIAAEPMLLVAFAVPATFLMERVGGILSISDVVLAVSTVVALFVVRPRDMRPISPLVWGGIAYLAAALPTTILNAYPQNAIEWAHEGVLVLGSLTVGFAIGYRGWAQFAVGIYIAVSVVLGAITSVVGLVMLAEQGTFGPVYLPELHKNLIGCALAVAIVILYGRPAWFRLSFGWTWFAICVCGVGVLASQSRQAMVGLAVGLVLVALRRNPETGKFPKLPWLAAIPIVLGVWGLVADQLASGNQYNSANQRLDWYAQSIEIWQRSPVFGVGLRWWYTTTFGVSFQPPNAEIEVLTSAGVVGLIGFLVMFGTGFFSLWRMDSWYGTVGAAVILTRFVQAQFDLYWVAGQASMLWIVAGLCYGALRRDTVRAREEGIVGALPAPQGRTRAVVVRPDPYRTPVRKPFRTRRAPAAHA